MVLSQRNSRKIASPQEREKLFSWFINCASHLADSTALLAGAHFGCCATNSFSRAQKPAADCSISSNGLRKERTPSRSRSWARWAAQQQRQQRSLIALQLAGHELFCFPLFYSLLCSAAQQQPMTHTLGASSQNIPALHGPQLRAGLGIRAVEVSGRFGEQPQRVSAQTACSVEVLCTLALCP